jgi:hypothetical protein
MRSPRCDHSSGSRNMRSPKCDHFSGWANTRSPKSDHFLGCRPCEGASDVFRGASSCWGGKREPIRRNRRRSAMSATMPAHHPATLLPCRTCARHVRVESERCPFCQHRLTPPLSARPTSHVHRPSRRTETALYLAGTSALAIAAAACGGLANTGNGGDGNEDSSVGDGAPVDGTAMDQFVGNTYGAPPPFDARVEASRDGASDARGFDSSKLGDTDRLDAECSDACSFGCCPSLPMGCCPAPPYGLPPPPDKP